MTQSVKDLILHFVGLNGAIKATDLAFQVTEAWCSQPNVPQRIDFVAVLEQLVKDGEVVEVEYVLPSQPHRIKTVIFPKGTEITYPKGSE